MYTFDIENEHTVQLELVLVARMIKRSDIKQDDIVRAAIEVFSQKGLKQASMEGIAKHAGVSKRTLYKYYPNKDALFEVIVDKLMCRFDERCNLTYKSDESLTSQLTELTMQQMCYVNTDEFQVTARLVMAECIRCPDASQLLKDKFEEIGSSCTLNEWVHQAQDAGAIKVDNVSLAVEQFIGSIKAVVFWPQLIAHQPPATCEQVKEAIDNAVHLFISAYGVKTLNN